MPELDGLDTARQIRLRQENSKFPLIYAMTAGGDKGDQENCLAAGMNGYIAKPIQVEELRSILLSVAPITSSVSPHSSAHVDWAKLTKLFQKNTDGLNALLTSFQKQTEQALDKMERVIKQDDNKELMISAHRSKGACANFGFNSLVPLLDDLEVMAERNDLTKAEQKLDEVKACFAAVCSELQEKRPSSVNLSLNRSIES